MQRNKKSTHIWAYYVGILVLSCFLIGYSVNLPLGAYIIGAIITISILIYWNCNKTEDFSSKNLIFWMMVLLTIFVFFNLTFFYVFQQSQNAIIWNQIWQFLQSGIFSVLAASILLPLLLFLIENIFKIREQADDERKRKQLDTISKNQKMWSELIHLTGKVKYFGHTSNNETIEDILIELDDFIVSFDEFIVQISEISDEIPFKKFESISFPVKILYYATSSVAKYISNGDDDCEELKISLNNIEKGLRNIHHNATSKILDDYFSLGSKKSKNKNFSLIDDFDYLDEYKMLLVENNDFLPIVQNIKLKSLEDLRKKAKSFEYWIRNNLNKNFENYYGFMEFKMEYNDVQYKLLSKEIKPVMLSKNFIRAFSVYLSLHMAESKLYERATWEKEMIDDIIVKNEKILTDPKYCYTKYDRFKLKLEYSTALQRKGTIFHELTEYDKAIEVYEKIIKIDQSYPYVWYSNGLALKELNDYPNAINSFKKATDLYSEYADAWYNRGLAFKMLNNYKDAVKSFDHALKLDPTNTDYLCEKGESLMKLGKIKEAFHCYDKVLKIDPNSRCKNYELI